MKLAEQLRSWLLYKNEPQANRDLRKLYSIGNFVTITDTIGVVKGYRYGYEHLTHEEAPDQPLTALEVTEVTNLTIGMRFADEVWSLEIIKDNYRRTA